MRLYTYLQESINDKAIFKACFVSGNPGAGKSYAIKKLTSGSISPRVVNSDIYTEFFGQGLNVDWSIYGNRIEQLSQSQLTQYINSVLPLWVDSTSSNPSNTIRRTGILESFGYDTAMIWVNTSLETSLKRNAQRKRQVPEDFLKEVYEKAQKIKPFYKSKFKNFWEINNDEGELTDNVILKAFKTVTSFYEAPLQNPIGQMFIEEIKKNKGKYLEDLKYWKDKGSLKSQLSGWFK